jgi:hypothetical protein
VRAFDERVVTVIVRPVHVLLRFSDKLFQVGDAMTAHQELIKRHGAVWLGKFGRPMAQRRADDLNEQIRGGVTTRVYLVQRARSGYVLYEGTVDRFAFAVPPSETRLIPPYYVEKSKRTCFQMSGCGSAWLV